MNARAVALDLLMTWSNSRRLADELVDERLPQAGLSPADKGLAVELFYGCLRRKLTLDWLIDQAATKPPRPVVRWILALGLYQLLFLDRVPAHAAVNESVNLARERATESESKFANAVLRRHVRALETNAAPSSLYAAAPRWVAHSHPQWLWERWVQRWGVADATALCEWNNQPPPIYVRFTGKSGFSTAELAAIAGGGQSPCHSLIHRVSDPATLFASTAWQQGALYAQDPSTLVAVDILDPQPGETVLDMCAAPGGKTTYIAQKMQDRGQIIAADASNTRLGMVAENCQRLGVTIVATIACEGTRLDRCIRGKQFDRVLVDAPCSNSGVMRRRVDLRWRLERDELPQLAGLQGRLLAKAYELAAPGGIVVYSTCSLEIEENERVVETFAREQPKAQLQSQRTIFPPRDGMDGAYVARFIKAAGGARHA